jgi:hypothetical protein
MRAWLWLIKSLTAVFGGSTWDPNGSTSQQATGTWDPNGSASPQSGGVWDPNG